MGSMHAKALLHRALQIPEVTTQEVAKALLLLDVTVSA